MDIVSIYYGSLGFFYFYLGVLNTLTDITELNDRVIQGKILKTVEEQRLVYGWAYVSTDKGEVAYDHSKEWIKPDTLEKAATDFMLTSRAAKQMHSGDKIADIVHSLPVTKDVAESLGIQTDREGWIIGVKVFDDATWEKVKSGELPSFSIGGRSQGGNPLLRG